MPSSPRRSFARNLPPFRGIIFVVLVLSLGLALAYASSGPQISSPSFAPGSLIIPMDTDTSGNHASYNQNNGMWKSYGLVYRLMQKGVPVHWAIDPTKTSASGVDFSASGVKDLRTTNNLSSWNYSGGAFIIDAADATTAKALIATWWSQNGNLPNVHEATAGFSAPTEITLRRAPRIANESINASVSMAYYNAAGIPDANGNPWSSTSPNIVNQTQIADGKLFSDATGCLERRYDVFVTPHNSGYSYSLTDPSNLGTKTYAQLDTFVAQGGGWTALCHSILSNEAAFANLTRNGSPAVKALFQTSLPGGKPGGLLTETGFSTISNTGGTWSILTSSAGLPAAQATPTTATPALPGGSVQNWPASGTGSPTYWGATSRIAKFNSSGSDYDQIIAGAYHDGTGQGQVTYIGGHSFSTGVPYTDNSEGAYLRMFFNSLLFNGAGQAQLDLVTAPTRVAQDSSGTLQLSLKNSGGTTATGLTNTTVTLEPGFSYDSTVSGPAPTSVSGRTLTWASLGDVASGQSAVTIKVAYNATASASAGKTKIASVSTGYGNRFGQSFTANFCRTIDVQPAPVPTLTKTPATQGPVTPGQNVTWTLTYGNSGGSGLHTPVLEDTLPPGFSYVSSSSTPGIGAPTVIPGTQTKLRWSTGEIAATTAGRTITVVARAGAVTSGATQTFTNSATLTGSDDDGNPLSKSATATVDVTKPELTLGKSVDKSSVVTPDSVTYTLTPNFTGNAALSNVRIIDPLPAGISAAPTVGQGGSYGAYTPIAAVAGSDGGGLDTTVTVSSNQRTLGQSLTVTVNLKSPTEVIGAAPTISVDNGLAASCSAPSPASATIPAGVAGVNFTFTCTPDELGEFIFLVGASDGSATDWPDATSASVLVVASGGPNVVTWSLGSTTAAVPGETISAGFKGGLVALHGNNTNVARKYSSDSNSWANLTSATPPGNIVAGGALTSDGAGKFYAFKGGAQTFYLYDGTVASPTWTTKANFGANTTTGAALVYLGGKVYALQGNGQVFKAYTVSSNSWGSPLAATGFNMKAGASLTTDGTYIYALRGDRQKTFLRYDPAAPASGWAAMTATPANMGAGAGLAHIGDYIYATRGDSKPDFYRYTISTNTWTTLTKLPANVNTGGALTTDGTYLYAFRGGSTAFYRYNPATNAWTAMAPTSANTGAGAGLAYSPSEALTGRFTNLSVNRSLVRGGQTLTVTADYTATTAITGVSAGTLTPTATGGASCSSLSGPTLSSTSPDNNISGAGDKVTYEWTCTVAAGASPGSLKFAAGGSGSGPVSFPSATSNSSLVTPELTFTATIPGGAPDPVTNTALIASSSVQAVSPTVETATGSPNLTITKANNPDHEAELLPGDFITYTMVVENSGSVPATSAVAVDDLPAEVTYVSCAGGSSCAESAGTVTWQLGTVAPGETKTVSVVVKTREDLAVKGSDYLVSNDAHTQGSNASRHDSNAVVNSLRVTPTVTKTVSDADAATGETLTYTLEVNNPGAAFTGDLSDALPTGTSFVGTQSCSPSCSFASSTVKWDAITIPHGVSSYRFDVTVTAGGGSTISNTGRLTPTSPSIDPIDSNEAVTEVGPEIGLVKSNAPTGEVKSGDTITYTMVATNESKVTATTAVVTDDVPTGTSYVSCDGGDSCSRSGSKVTWQLGNLAGGATQTVTMTVTVASPPSDLFAITNEAEAHSSNSTEPQRSNEVSNPLPLPELTLTKTASPTTYQKAGDTISYSYKVSNNTSSTITGPVTVSDDKTTVTCPAGNLAALASLTCTSTYTITATDVSNRSLTNTATASAGGKTSNEATATVTFVGANLQISKSHSGDFARGQEGATYTLAVSNAGQIASSGEVTVIDTLPTGLTATAISGSGWTCDLDTLSCTRSNALAVGDSYPDITVTVDVADDATSEVTNIAEVSGGGDSDASDNSDEDKTTVRAANLSLTKTHTGDFAHSQTGASYELEVANAGPGASSGEVTVSDSLPLGLSATAISGDGWTCDLPTLTCTRSDSLASGSSYPAITVTVDVAVDAASPLTNSATVSGGGDEDPSDNSDDDETTILSQDVTITKSHSGDFERGQTGATYTLAVENLGPGATFAEVSVSDTLPAGLTATAISGDGWTCDKDTLTCTRSDSLAKDASYPDITVTVDVAADAPSSVTNLASVTMAGDDDTSNNSDDDETTILAPDLTITKSHSGDFERGQEGATYTLTVTNAGQSATTGEVSVSDTLPAGLTATAIAGDGWTCDLDTLTCTRSDALAKDTSYPDITVTVDVASDADAEVTNSASVSGGGEDKTDNNSADDKTTILAPDLTIAKSHSGDFERGQEGATYTISVTNQGDGATHGEVTVSDTLPVGLTATAIAGDGWTCDLGGPSLPSGPLFSAPIGTTVTCTRSDSLAKDASYPDITVTVDVAADAAAEVTNTASVALDGDDDTSNNSDDDKTTILAPDLTIAKSHTGDFERGQEGATYTLTVTNSGQSATVGEVSVSDTLPVGLTATAISGTGWTCDLGTLTCVRSDALAKDTSYPDITVTVDVAADAAAEVTNSASVSGGAEDTIDNNSDDDKTTILAPDLTIAKSHSGSFHLGQTGEPYTITVTNSGQSATVGEVSVTDTLPTGLTATAISGDGWTCDLGTLTCVRSDALAKDASYPDITVTVDVADDAPSSVTNTATVSGGGDDDDSNNSDDDETTIVSIDLAISKSHSGDFERGQTGATYTLAVENISAHPTVGEVTVTDTLPTGLTATAISGDGWSCDLDTLTCTRSDALAGEASYPDITVTVDVADDAAAEITNSASLSGGGDGDDSNNSADDKTTVLAPDLTIAKSHTGDFERGQTGAEYTLTVTNDGQAPTVGEVSVTDTLPEGLTATAISGTGWTCDLGTLTCTRSDALAKDTSYPDITVTVDVASDADAEVTNSAAVSGGSEDKTDNNSDDDKTTILAADLTIAKSHTGDFDRGQTGATYTLTVSNDGQAPTSGEVSVTDTLPEGLTATAISGDGWSCDLDTLTCVRSDALAKGESYPDITVTVDVASDAAGSVTNTAAVSGGSEDKTDNNSDDDETTVLVPDLTIAKSHSGDFERGQDGATYTLSVSNDGQAPTVGEVAVSDTLPTGLTATAISGTGWTCDLGTLTCVRSDALAKGESYPDITVTVDVADDAPSSLTNSASVSGGTDGDDSNNSDDDETTILAPDLTINKSHSGDFQRGQEGAAYTLSVTNSGQSATVGEVSVTDTLPTGLTATAISGDGWSCDLDTLTCVRSDALAKGDSYPDITVTVDVASNAAGSVTNTAAVSGGGDGDDSNNSDDDETTVISIDLVIDKSHSGNFARGQQGATYSLVVTNGGSNASSGQVTVSDTLPAGLTATAISGTGWSCTLATLTCTRSNALAAGQSYPTITVAVNVASDAPASLTNTADVSGGGDDNTGNNSASDPTTVRAANLTIAKSHSGNFDLGQQGASYSLVVSNAGPGATNGEVTVSDTLPTGLSATAISGTGWSCELQTLTCVRSNSLASGQSYPAITVTVNVADNAPSSLVNTATVAGGGDEDPGNNSATDPTTIRDARVITHPLTVQILAGSGSVSSSSGGIACGSAGTVCGASYVAGTLVTLTATPDDGYDFKGWGGACSGTALTCVVTMTQARQVTAEFVKVAPKLVLKVTISKKKVNLGETVIARLKVTNKGDGAADQTKICSDIPAGFTLVKASKGAKINGRQICWKVNTLDPGDKAERWMKLRSVTPQGGKVPIKASTQAKGVPPKKVTTNVAVSKRPRPRPKPPTG